MKWVPKKAKQIQMEPETHLAPKTEQTMERQTAMNLVPMMAAMIQMVPETNWAQLKVPMSSMAQHSAPSIQMALK